MLIESECYVVYYPEKQLFLGGTSKIPRMVIEFKEARLFPKIGSAKNAAKVKRSKEGVWIGHVLPVKLTFDPKDLFVANLKGGK